ncbi:MAG: hypothetical protein US68_C0017G0018 [Candidatus Shapirobacteria bacterium GW2011_GWE1_38_10]|uniref:Uncharacterized protein n=1 Tax=Candidatus Shapirobacteria bacterium GW2011_GWE1_38_10 TaxID=1618488 RepID=A0A0G0I3W7_9BACT|nr:MAG: hypothetical protein US46_C0011G0005 [Candidatus Shapirobacteria bacterium GW2011_GWF2_37_20]KKQ49237.1 MAG: hypothetical protein US68_C0017G0018 [Candidatus Shapirobacteria bacterium GW2011_GWE1_38_10]KKQ62883.1 MAG: hypothetical protein US85_C0021G0012 [Candidatus Shapirobacteria bacterium GW2011_GWF1_38_23]HBP50801.1 hypothetical protein [Candidatus Shapirobacteria bacterium]
MSEVDCLSYKSIPTKPLREHPLGVEWRDTSQLRGENEVGIYVNQGHASVAKRGEVLSSEGFGQCSGVVLHNVDTGEAYLAHLSDWNLSESQYEEMNKLSKGKYKLLVLVGKESRVTKDSLMKKEISEFQERFRQTTQGGEIVSSTDIVVDSGDRHWSMAYDPKLKVAKVFTRKGNMVREYQ